MPSKKKSNSRRAAGHSTGLASGFASLGVPNTVAVLRAGHQPFPDQYVCNLVYEQHGRVNPALSPSTVQTFNLNSVFDPDRSGTGHQPRGYDQLAALYDRYRVLQAKVEITVRQRETHGLLVTFLACNTATAQNGQFASENAWASRPCVTSSNQAVASISKDFKLNQITGATPTSYLGDDRFQALVTSNPAEIITFQVVLESMDGTTYVDCEYTARITYLTQFSDRVIPGSSFADRRMILSEDPSGRRRLDVLPFPATTGTVDVPARSLPANNWVVVLGGGRQQPHGSG